MSENTGNLPSNPSNISISICDDSKILEELKSTNVLQKNIRNTRESQSLPVEHMGHNTLLGGVNNRLVRRYNRKYNSQIKQNTELEKKLDVVREQFAKKNKMYYNLGLTPGSCSHLISPSTEAIDIEDQVLERREEIGFRRRTFWKSCCGAVVDRRAIQFFVQVIIGSGVMLFCMAKIWQAVPLHGCTGEDTTVYFSLLSALVGFYIPSPSMNKH